MYPCILSRYCGGKKEDYVWGPLYKKLVADITCPKGIKETNIERQRRKHEFAKG